MAELADALDSGSSRGNSVEVQVLLPAPKSLDGLPSRLFLLLVLQETTMKTIDRDRFTTNREMIGSFLEGSKLLFAASILCAAISSVFDMVAPQVIRLTVDNVFGTEPLKEGTLSAFAVRFFGGLSYLRENLWILAACIVAAALIRAAAQYLFRVFNTKASETFVKTIRDQLYAHMERLPYSWHSSNKTGDILQRSSSDVEMIKNFFSEQLTSLFRTSLYLLSSMYFIFAMNTRLTLLSLIPMPIIMFNSYRFFKQVAERFRECDDNEGILSSICQENLTGVRVVRAFGMEKYELDKFETQNRFYTGLWEKMGDVLSGYWSTSDFLSGMQIMLVVILGAVFCVKNSMTSGEYVAFVAYNYKLIWPIRQLGRMLSEMSKAGVSADRIRDIMLQKEEEVKDTDLLPDMRQEIRFSDVSFSFGQNEVLKDVSFTIPYGSTLGILGGIGSGKSTMMMLLDKMYPLDKENGEITIGGTDIRQINTPHLRKNIGFVLQEPFLFSRSIAENIGIAREGLSLEKIRDASSVASLDEAVMSFANGYDTFVGERGVTLSGGQKQRVAIARMLTQETPIMIFDDSFSAIDMETDAKIRSALENKYGTATIILISHRVSTLSKADNILVLEHGRILEQGKHEELIRSGGLYQRIYEIQSGAEEAVLNER